MVITKTKIQSGRLLTVTFLVSRDAVRGFERVSKRSPVFYPALVEHFASLCRAEVTRLASKGKTSGSLRITRSASKRNS